MAEFYSSSEIGLHNGGIREGGCGYNRRVFDDERRNEIEGFQSLSHSHDHGLSIRVLDTSSRFEWNSLMNESRGGSRSNGVRENTRVSGFGSRGEDYDGFVERSSLPVERERTRNVITYDPTVDELRGGLRSNGVRDELVERSLPFVSERTGNVPTYDRNVGGSEYSCEARNVTRNHSFREYPSRIERELTRPHYDDENDLGFHPGDGSHSLTPRALSNGQRTPFQGIANKGDYSVRERDYPPRLDRVLVRQPYDDESGIMFRREEGSHSLTPRSHSSSQRTPFQGIANDDLLPEVQYHSADGIRSGSRLHSPRSSRYHRTPYSNTGGTSHPFPTEAISPRGEFAPSVHRLDDYIHPESRRSRTYRETVAEDNYDNDHSVQNYNDQGVTFGIEAVNSTLPRHHYDGYSNRDVIIEDEYSGRQKISPPPQVERTLDNSGGSMIGYEMAYGEVNIHPRNSYPDHSTEVIRGSLPREEQFTYERNAYDMSYEGQYVNSPRQNDGDPLMDTRGFLLPEQSNTTRKRMHEIVDEMCDAKRRSFSTRGSRYDERHHSVENEGELTLSNRITHHHDEPHSRAHIGMSHERPLSKPQESDRGDIKKRLIFPQAVSRPCAPQLSWKKEVKSRVKSTPHVTHTTSSIKPYGKAKGTDSKKKLKSVPRPVVCPSGSPDPVVLDSGLNMKKKQKVATKDSVSVNDAPRSQVVNPDRFVLKVKRLEELPEDSGKFKQQVDEWFLKCIWHLFGNIGCQERFKGQGNGGLKCIICLPSSPAFVQTKDLAMHAFSSTKAGYRAQHLGFHRALYALMGWDRGVIPNDRWVCKPLPELVAWTLKEDIIIWPPVVIIHKNPARNYQLNELGKVSIDLEKFLRDNGFTREIKSYHENPGNPTIMVVKFSGTLPGLKEAERLHKFFAGNKHGRVELAQIDAEVVCCKLLYKKPEVELKLVNKRDDDQKPVYKTKDEQPEYKTEKFQKIVDKREDDDDPLDKTNVDQQLVVMAQDGQDPIDTAQDDQTPVVTAQDDQTLVVTAQDDHTLVVTSQDDQTPVVTAHDDQTHVLTAQDDKKPVVTARDDQKPVVTVQYDQKPVVTAQHDQEPMVMTQNDQESMVTAQDDQEPIVTAQLDQKPVVTAQEDQKSVVMAQHDQEPMVMAQNDQEPIVTAQDDQEPIVMAQYDQEPMVMAQDDQEPIVTALVDHAPVGKTEDDHALVNKTDYVSLPVGKISDCQAPLDMEGNDQEPLDKAKYDEKPVVKTKDDQEPVGKTEDALYGYFGIIEDLNRLHYDIMCHHRARSKKEILAFL